MAFRLHLFFFIACVAVTRSAIIQSEYPMTLTNQITPQEFVPQMPFHPLPSPGMTVQSGAVQYLAPEEEKLVTYDKLDKLIKASGYVGKFKLHALALLTKGIKLFGKFAVVGVVALAVATLAVGVTAVICKHTGLCSLKLHKFQVEQLEAVRSLASNEKLASLTKYVFKALEEYSDKEE